MSTWIRTLKRVALSMAAVAVAFSWSGTGIAQNSALCLITRGQDPLDVLNSGVRNNVWLILDTSGSMNGPLGNSKLSQAQTVINRLMDELVDGAGRPLVNWGFVHYGENFNKNPGGNSTKCPAVPPDLNGDTYPDNPVDSIGGSACPGLKDDSFVNPGTCNADSRPAVKSVLNSVTAQNSTPIGIAFSDIGSYLVGNGLTANNTTNFVTGLLPNQKNFIIQLTDGVDTCECESGGYPGVIGSPLVTPVNLRSSETDANVLTSSAVGSDIASFNAGLKGEFALKQIDPALDGSKGNIFVIGFDITAAEKARVSNIAWMSSGAGLSPQRAANLMNPPYFAEANTDQLLNAFRDILARIGIPTTEVTLGAPIVASVKEVVHSRTNTALQREEVLPLDLNDSEEIRLARVARSNHRNNVLFTTSVEVPNFRGHLRATNIYTVNDPDLPRSARDADVTDLWDAGTELRDDNPDSRVLYFNRRGFTDLLPFNTSNVTPGDLNVSAGYLRELDGVGARTDADARDIVVKVMRGYRLSIDPVTKTLYDSGGDLNFSTVDENGDPTWKLYESTAAAVAVASNPPRSPDFDSPTAHASEYGVGGAVQGDGFYWDHFNRPTVAYYPSNAGIMHAFDAATGAELFGYLPDDVLGLDSNEIAGSRDTLRDFVRLVVANNNGIINHQFTLSGAPNVDDVFLRADRGGDDNWHTVLSFGRGRGGRFMTVLDVTDPLNPKLRWNRGNREGINDGPLDGLGETWSVPVLGSVDTRSSPAQTDNRVDQWLLFAGGGYGCDNSNDEGQFFFAFRIEDGFIYHRAQVTSDPLATVPNNALPATATLFNPHVADSADFKDVVTRAYIPDLQGRVWKLDTSDVNPALWTFNIFAQLGVDHPIIASVTTLIDAFDPTRIYIMAGSGGDRRAPVPAGGFKFRTWVDRDADGSNTTQYTPSDAPIGEVVFFPEERMFVPAVTLGRVNSTGGALVFLAASREDFDVVNCAVTFSSTLYARTIKGASPNFDLDGTQAGLDYASLGDGKAQGLFARDGNLYVSESGGLGSSGKVGIWGERFAADPAPPGFGQFTLQLLIEGFRISPF